MWRCLLAFGTVLLALAGPAHGAWSSDPTQNLVVADGASDQILPKLAATTGGGCYVSWFDGYGNGYDVRLQRLDGAGNEALPHNGVLVADRNFSSVTDFGLDTDTAGNAIVAFPDDRFVGEQITAARIAPDGTLLWGANGVQLTNTTEFVASPAIAGTSDGGIVVAWTQESSARLQKLDSDGNPLWGGGLTFTPAAGSFSVCDLHDAGSDVIVSFVHQTGGFGSPRHLLAQKLDADGNLLWGASHVAVFDGGSLQMGNFPAFVPDELGGAVLFWYDASTLQLQCYAQHVRSNGTEAFPHNGTAVSTNTARVRVSPWAAFDPASGETFVFWREQNSSQSQSGLYGQKLDAAGVRQWTNEGRTYIPLGADVIEDTHCLAMAGGAFVAWNRSPGFGQDRLQALRVDATGDVLVNTVEVSSTPSAKSRLFTVLDDAGFAILAWSDGRADDGDIYAQNVNPDGSLGGSATGIDAADVATPARRVTVRPNPARGPVLIECSAPDARGEILISDAMGRTVRTLVLPGGGGTGRVRGRILWDGRDERGARVGGGVYYVRRGDDPRSVSPVVVVP
jgi:hypothetical protein